MAQVSPSELEQDYADAGRFVVYADFNCPFCYALNERLHAMGLDSRVEFRSVQHAPSASSAESGVEVLARLSSEVADVRRRAPSVQLALPSIRPGSAAAARLLATVDKQFPGRASQLRRRIFRALWVDGLDISDPQVLAAILDQLDIQVVPESSVDSDLDSWQSEWKENSEFRGNVPVVISEQGEKVIGFPLEPELNAFLKTGSLVSDEAMQSTGEQNSLQRIVVLDDDIGDLRTILQQMKDAQVEIVRDFATLVASAVERGMPDLVLVNTALIGGTEGTDWWRSSIDPSIDTSLPVIFLSSDKSIEAEVVAFEAGAADFIAKPLHPRVLRARLKMHLHARESQRQLNNIARVDALTSICNRREFDLRLMSEWSRGARTGQSLALLMIDVDKFKEYNDHYGHLRGDKCLVAVARVLQSCTQRNSDLIARYGGEEFVALLPDSDLEGALTVAEDCLAALAEADIEHANSSVAPRITVSIGVAAMLPLHDKSSTVLIEQADVALYQAKQTGRNRICSFDQWS